jgi:hypothetical protein
VLLEKFKETTKSARDTAEVNPQTRAQSKRRPKNNSPSLVGEWSISSKIRLLRSRQTVHIKQRGTRFQTEELCLPKQLNQPKSRSATVLGNTQRTPKECRIKCHKSEAIGQWIKRWLPVSPLLQHIQHQPNRGIVFTKTIKPTKEQISNSVRKTLKTHKKQNKTNQTS